MGKKSFKNVPQNLVTVARYGNVMEAHLARTLLASKGITAFVADEHILTIDPFYDLGLGGVRLQVPEALLENAAKALGGPNRGSLFVPPRWYALAILVPLFILWLFMACFSFFGSNP